MPSPNRIVHNRKNHHCSKHQAGPIHLCRRWFGISWEEGKDECERQEHEGKPVQEEAQISTEGELGGEEFLVRQSSPEQASDGDDI